MLLSQNLDVTGWYVSLSFLFLSLVREWRLDSVDLLEFFRDVHLYGTITIIVTSSIDMFTCSKEKHVYFPAFFCLFVIKCRLGFIASVLRC